MILIFVPVLTSRIKYIFNLIFKEILSVSIDLTDQLTVFEKYSGPKFSYGPTAIEKSPLHFSSVQLLFENTIDRLDIEVHINNFQPTFFPVSGGQLNYDPFASSFYLVSRYEEYLPHTKDLHGRFTYNQSLAFKNGFLERPMVNVWSREIKRILIEKYPALEFPRKNLTFQPTVDIDNAYAYKYKGFVRIIGSLFTSLLHFKIKDFWKKILVHLGITRDPYDTYNRLHDIHKKYNVTPLYFVLLGNYGKYDTNISHRNKHYRSLIRTLDQQAEVSIHPSYNSVKSGQLSKEKHRLEEILKRTVTKSRHHFIRISLPVTYRKLVQAGFTEDYSMGFPDRAGFRAGIATPFYFFDLEEDKETGLLVYPFVAMDVTLKKYMHIRSKDVVAFLEPIMKECKSLGGYFMFIFHNESMSGERIWKNWFDVYENIIKLSRD